MAVLLFRMICHNATFTVVCPALRTWCVMGCYTKQRRPWIYSRYTDIPEESVTSYDRAEKCTQI